MISTICILLSFTLQNIVGAANMHGLGTDVTICDLLAYALRRRSCKGMFLVQYLF